MDKSKDALLFEFLYAQRLCALHRCFFGRVRIAFQVITLFGAAGAFKSAIIGNPGWAVGSGLVLTLVAILDQVVKPAEKSAAFREDYKRYARALTLVRNLDAKKIQDKLDSLRVDDEVEIESFRQIAYNRAIDECGLEGNAKYRLSMGRRFLSALT